MWRGKTNLVGEQHENTLQKHSSASFPPPHPSPSHSRILQSTLPPVLCELLGLLTPYISYTLLPTSIPLSPAPSGGGTVTRGVRVQKPRCCFVCCKTRQQQRNSHGPEQGSSWLLCSARLHKPAARRSTEGKRRQEEWQGLRCPD